MNSNPFFQSQLPSFMLGSQITVFYYFASLLYILFISVVLPSFLAFFQKLYLFLLLFVLLVKPPIAITYLSQRSGRFLCRILATPPASLIWNWMLGFHEMFWFICSLGTFVIFPNQTFCSWGSDYSRCPPPTNHQRNNRTGVDRIEVGHTRLLNWPEIRKVNSTVVRCPVSTELPVTLWAGVCLSFSELQEVRTTSVLFTAVSPQFSTMPDP